MSTPLLINTQTTFPVTNDSQYGTNIVVTIPNYTGQYNYTMTILKCAK